MSSNTSLPLNKRTLTVRDAVFDLLRELGMRTIFGNPGSTELAFLTPWPADLHYVLALQEASAVAMADAYAQATGNAAFVNLPSAAGLGNGLGTLYTAFRNQSPLIVTAGQQTRSLLLYDPYLGAERATEFPRPYVKWACEPARAEDVPATIAQAYAIAMERPRGPVFVSIPSDDWDKPTVPVHARRHTWDVAPLQTSIAELADALTVSKKPALVVGSEVDRQDAYALAVELAEQLNIPVFEAPNSSRSRFPEDHRLFAGFLPAIPEHLSDALQSFDLVLVIGAPVFSFHVPGKAAIFDSGPRIFQITDNPLSAARSQATDTIVGSMVPALNGLLQCLPKSSHKGPQIPRLIVPVEARDPIQPDFAMQEIARAVGRDIIVVEEAPSHRPSMQKHLPILRPKGFYTMASGGLGWGLPAAVGVALAEKQPVICLIGDGSAMYSIQALWTAVQEKLPMVMIVLNNHGYGAMKSFSQLLGTSEPPGIRLPGISYPDVARGFGAVGVEVTRSSDIYQALQRAIQREVPTLIDIQMDPNAGDLY
ncbi:benzoylformate decarboxylase [Acidicapsa acidisoli]|uniref:benzoylformate decarboxylase n=1 Tax=Acidicapsa acidisoli TaxID=1615681 RepID=UPI0021E0C98E|nr:benzoylformate decarboxylase [Acidicapsa acidisoli]